MDSFNNRSYCGRRNCILFKKCKDANNNTLKKKHESKEENSPICEQLLFACDKYEDKIK